MSQPVYVSIKESGDGRFFCLTNKKPPNVLHAEASVMAFLKSASIQFLSKFSFDDGVLSPAEKNYVTQAKVLEILERSIISELYSRMEEAIMNTDSIEEMLDYVPDGIDAIGIRGNSLRFLVSDEFLGYCHLGRQSEAFLYLTDDFDHPMVVDYILCNDTWKEKFRGGED